MATVDFVHAFPQEGLRVTVPVGGGPVVAIMMDAWTFADLHCGQDCVAAAARYDRDTDPDNGVIFYVGRDGSRQCASCLNPIQPGQTVARVTLTAPGPLAPGVYAVCQTPCAQEIAECLAAQPA